MKKLLIIPSMLLVLAFTKATAQQLPLTNQYMLSPGLVNPSMITVYKKMEVFGMLRKQWTDIAGAPNTQIITLNGALKKNKSYLGATIMHDQIGLWRQLSLYGNFAYRLKLQDEMFIDLGMNFGGIQRTYDFAKVEVRDIDDPDLTQSTTNSFNFDASFGFTFVYNKLRVGVSSYQLLENDARYVLPNTTILYKLNRQINANAQYTFVLNESNKMVLVPLVVARYTTEASQFNLGAPLQFDANVLFDVAKYGWLLVAYKSDYALSAGVGIHVNKAFHFGFSYDFPFFSTVQTYIGQTAEVTFRYTFKSSGSSSPQFLY